MDFIKKHYEKLLLGLILAGLVGALVFMPFYIQSDSQKMHELIDSIIKKTPKPLTNIDLTVSDAAISRLKTPPMLDLDSTNKLFNSGVWQKTPDGFLIPANTRTGPRVVVVTNTTPLYFTLKLDSVTTNEFGARYVISAERQAEKSPAKRHPMQHYVSVGEKPNDVFGLLQVVGADPVSPDYLVVKLTDSGEIIHLAPGKPFQRVDGYSVDFRYDPEKKVF